jgi:VIT1/CCC1 family predicted Fe2+/Mn2+ transporter
VTTTTDNERHRTGRTGWLRPAVLGANDGLLSVGALVFGVAASNTGHSGVFIAGIAAWLAGAMSMAAGEYVSVSSQADTQKADLGMEQRELDEHPKQEHKELADIYVRRGLDRELADQVATQLIEHNALQAHARDEIGISDTVEPKPLRAALASALSFTLGVAPVLIVIGLVPHSLLLPAVIVVVLIFLAVLGALGAWTGGAEIWKGTLRVTIWGALALAVTGVVGGLIGHP